MLANRINKEILKERLKNETFRRITISFYRYMDIKDPLDYRNSLYQAWSELQCFGRIYVAREGINAQMSVPEHRYSTFLDQLEEIPGLKSIPVKQALEDDGKSFYKLTIKVKPKLVADGLEEGVYDFSKVGRHLEALEFHQALEHPDTVVIDIRNHYESEIGKFAGAITPLAGTFREAIREILSNDQEFRNKKVLLYCTGGIRCEKASAVLLHHGFRDVNQLHGGIIEYAQQMRALGIESKFTGKNFVFDLRMGEQVNAQVIARCHQCGNPADTHTNCANQECHLLFIQCPDCSSTYRGCCSAVCRDHLLSKKTNPNPVRRTFNGSKNRIHNQRLASLGSVEPNVILTHD